MVRQSRGGRWSSRPARAVRLLPVVSLVLGLVVACGGTTTRPGAGPVAGNPPPAASEVRLSPEEYQRQLSTVNTALAQAWQSVASAGPYDAAGDALSGAGAAVSRAADQLDAMAPPAGTEEIHPALVAGLRQLATDLAGLGDQVSSSTLCANPSVRSNLSTSAGTVRLRDVAARLHGAGFQWGDFLGTPLPLPDYRLANGALVTARHRGGLGQLTVDNGNESDAVVTLAQGGAPVLSMYVRHGGDATLTGVPDGSYQVFFSVGDDWSVQDRLFTRSCQFSQFDDLMSFSTVHEADGTQYSTYRVTLQPVVGGTAATSTVRARDFPH